MTTNASAAISLIALLFYSVLFFVLLKRGFQRREDQFFGLFLLSMIVWCLGSFMMFANLNFQTTLFWNRFMVFGSMGMPISLYGFVKTFLIKGRSGWLKLGLLSYVVVIVTNQMGYVILDAYISDGLLYNVYGPGIYINSFIWALFIGLLGYDLLKAYKQSNDPLYRNRIKYLFVVTFLTFAGAVTNLTVLSTVPFDIALNAISALLISYAIFRHQLLDIGVVVRRGLLYSIPTIILGAGYFFTISLALNIFNVVSGSRLFLFSFIVAIITALVAQPLYEKAQLWIDLLFYRDKYDSSLMLQRISAAASVLDLETLTNMILEEVSSTLHIEKAAFFSKDENGRELTLIAHNGIEQNARLKLENRNPIVQWLIKHRSILTKNDLEVLPQFKGLWVKERDKLDAIGAEIYIPLLVYDTLVGILMLGPKLSEEPYSYDDQLNLTTLANQTAVAIEKARLYTVAQHELAERIRAEKQLQLQLQRMNALRAIDISITTTFTLEATFSVLLEQVITQLGVDAAAVLLLNDDETLDYHSGVGFHTSALEHTKLEFGEGLAGLAAKDQDIVFVPDISATQTPLNGSALLQSEGFVTYLGLPIIAKGNVRGVLEIFHRSKLHPDKEWLEFLETLATEAAIVIDNVSLFQELQHSNFELEAAYETTLEGWASALELRDKETVGHSRRVSDLTVLLAQTLGVDKEALTHIRRGALLHDIGKMGVSDELLLKPGPLTPEEAEIMAQHPVYAHKLLAKIPYLEPALSIPYYHHEKWDGTGYPLGLSGDEIPLAARIFAVVDVWDALLSDRPYRPAWTVEEALSYIREQSNKHFDPQVVDVFLQLVADMKILEIYHNGVLDYNFQGNIEDPE